MSFLAKYSKLVLSSIVAFFVLMLINHLVFTMREGLENPPASTTATPAVAAVPSEQQKASVKTINELQTESPFRKTDAKMFCLFLLVALSSLRQPSLSWRKAPKVFQKSVEVQYRFRHSHQQWTKVNSVQ